MAEQIGALLIEAKKKIDHGEWLNWLLENVTFGERTARNYMRVARSLPKLEHSDRQRVADLSFRDLLGTLATDTTKLAKLPTPSAVLEVAETEPVRRAVTRTSTAEHVRREQARPLAAEAVAIVADAPVFRAPAWRVEFYNKVVELARQVMTVHGVETAEVLDALNDAYCLLQDSEGAT